MASAWWRQHKKRRTVIVCYRNEAGVQVQHATKCRNLSEGKRMADELEQRADRVRRGIEKPWVEDISFAEAADLYVASLPPEYASLDSLVSRLNKRIKPKLGKKPLRTITAADVQKMLNASADASIQTREHLRVAVQAVFTYCIEQLNRKELENPAKKIGKLDIPEREPLFLSQSELLRLFEEIPQNWRIPFLVSVATAIRKGELLPLLKTDVVIAERYIRITKSHSAKTPKTKRERRVPIPEWLVPYLEEQLRTAPGPMLFPNEKGKQWSRWVKLHERVAAALRRAGMVKHYELVCRRKDCKAEPVVAMKKETPHCSVCGFKLFPRAVPIDFRWKDLRSTWATHAAAMTGDIRFVQVVLGHGSVVTTTKRYAHALPSHIKAQAGRVDLGFERVSETQVGPAEFLSTPTNPTNSRTT